MTKVVLFFALTLLFATLVSADFGVQIKYRDSGKKIDCTLGETTCFDYFFQKCMRDSVSNIMWNTIDTCRVNEACDNVKGCLEFKQETVRPPIKEPKELPSWMECEKQESKCSDDLTQILWCKNNKWEARQVCSSDAVCLNKYGCILKEEVQKEVSPENYAKMLSAQNKEEIEKAPMNELTVESAQNQITGNVIKRRINPEDSLENLLKELKKILLAILP